MKKKYGRDGSRILLNVSDTVPPVVIAVATDATWATVLVDGMNRWDAEIEEKSATTKAPA